MCGGGVGGWRSPVKLAFPHCFVLVSTAVFSGIVFVTVFPTTVQTLNVDSVMPILTFYRFDVTFW